MTTRQEFAGDKPHVGDVRPSQLLYTYGIGSIVDLPNFSVLVMGLDDWPTSPDVARPIVEDRLLAAIRTYGGLGGVSRLLSPPAVRSSGNAFDSFDTVAETGVPVAAFPRWMVCPICRRLASVDSGLFKRRKERYGAGYFYVHENCSTGRQPMVVPARFVVACENGHLDDFPWLEYVHSFGPLCATPLLRLYEYGMSGEARDLVVKCESCEKERRLADAFGRDNRRRLPACLGRHPHLREYAAEGCDRTIYPLVLGASNLWFPLVRASIAVPSATARIDQLVEQNWNDLQTATLPAVVTAFRQIGRLGAFAQYSDEQLWAAIERRRQSAGAGGADANDLLLPEWRVFTHCNPVLNTGEFCLRPVRTPAPFAAQIAAVLLVERLREVRALTGFTRIDSPGEALEGGLEEEIAAIAPLTRGLPTWLPATEVRGEGVFLQLREEALADWLVRPAVLRLADDFHAAHLRWCKARGIDSGRMADPGMRYILLHSLAHALMRQMAVEAGYTAASIRERIYARSPQEVGGPMAGILLYTAAPDSEGTLGGLVRLGEPEQLERILGAALESMTLCASDPTCAEHLPSTDGMSLHAAACHACLFAPETSCERGNRYLDRSTLVGTFRLADIAFFGE